MRVFADAFARFAGFGRDHRGGVAVWAVLLAPPMLSVAALAVDISRVYGMEAEMQSAADALARAGAFELDGSADAITRAERAIAGLVANDQHFADTGGSQVAVSGVRFLSTLPPSDTQAVTASYVTTNPRLARYVEVSTRPENLTTLFPTQLVSGFVRTEVSARSIGSRQAQMCGAAPLFICNPVEDTGEDLGQALESDDFRGRLIKLRGKGGAAQYAPGQFGYLEPPGGGGASALKAMFAEVSPATCFESQGVELRTGVVSSTDQGMNTRFGIYGGGFRASDYPAAPITRSYPQDNCFAAGTCTRMGDGVWNFQAYMKANYPGRSTATIGGVTYSFNHAANTVTPSNTRPSRFQVYKWEHEAGAITPGNPDRRVMPVAVLNCQGGLSGSTVPVQSFAKVFLTEPMGAGTEDVIWGELAGVLRPGADVQARDQVDVRR